MPSWVSPSKGWLMGPVPAPLAGPVSGPVIGPVGGRGVWPGRGTIAGAIGVPQTTHTPSRGGALLPQREHTMPGGLVDYGLKVDTAESRPADAT